MTTTAVYLILQRADRDIWIMRRCNTGYQDGMYQVPAGHVEEGELPTEALIREAREEVGLTIEPEDLEFVHFSARPKHDDTGNRNDIYFRVRRWTGEPRNAEPDKCDEARWSSIGGLPENTTPHIRHALQMMCQKFPYREHSLEWIKAQPQYGIR